MSKFTPLDNNEEVVCLDNGKVLTVRQYIEFLADLGDALELSRRMNQETDERKREIYAKAYALCVRNQLARSGLL